MSNHDHEYELKFAARSPKQAALLCTMPALSGMVTLGAVHTTQHIDLYFDTADHFLLRHGFSLRRRHTPDSILWTAKTVIPSQTYKRWEVESAALPDNLNDLPTALFKLLRERFDAELPQSLKLQPIALIQQTRHKRMIQPAGATLPLAELSMDEVRIFPSDALPAGDDVAAVVTGAAPLTTFWEVEAELLPGQNEAQLEQIGEQLAKLRGLKPVAASKFERALSAEHNHLQLDDRLVCELQPTMTMADGCRLILRRQLAQILLNESGVRRDDDMEFVHDMRVAVRRARTALRLFGDHFRAKTLHKLRIPLRTTGRYLGAVRDLDVALARLAATDAADEANTGGEDSEIAAAWRRQRQHAFNELLGWLDSAEYSKFVTKFARFCATAGKGNRTLSNQPGQPAERYEVRHVVPLELATRFANVRAFEVQLEAGREPPLPALHQLRITCKELRYLLEFCEHLLGQPGVQLIAALKQLQTSLGDLNDAAVMQAKLAAFDDATQETTVTTVDAAQAATIELLRAGAMCAFLTFVGRENRRRLARAWSAL